MANALSDINGAGPGFPDWMLEEHQEDDPSIYGKIEHDLVVGGGIHEPHSLRGFARHELAALHISTRPAGLTRRIA